MSTSDGISTEDWDMVQELALNVVNAEADGESNIYTKQLLQYLEQLIAYHFENDNFGNILLDVEELAVAKLVQGYRDLFEKGSKEGWPSPCNVSTEACIDHFQSKGAKAFEISSSWGLDGWVISESYRLEQGKG